MSRLRFRTAQDVFEAFPSAAGDIQAKPNDDPVIYYVADRLRSLTPEDAVSFVAYLLPRREAVWWACRCIRNWAPPQDDDGARLLEAAEQWVREPEDGRRCEALSSGLAGDPNEPETWAALAAGWSGGGMTADENAPQCSPALTARAVRIATLTALSEAPLRDRSTALGAIVQDALALIDLKLPA